MMLTQGGEATREAHVGPGPLVAVIVTARPLTTPATSPHPRLLPLPPLLQTLLLPLLLLVVFTLLLSDDHATALTMALGVPATIDTLVTDDTVVTPSQRGAVTLLTTTLLALWPTTPFLTPVSWWLTAALTKRPWSTLATLALLRALTAASLTRLSPGQKATLLTLLTPLLLQTLRLVVQALALEHTGRLHSRAGEGTAGPSVVRGCAWPSGWPSGWSLARSSGGSEAMHTRGAPSLARSLWHLASSCGGSAGTMTTSGGSDFAAALSLRQAPGGTGSRTSSRGRALGKQRGASSSGALTAHTTLTSLLSSRGAVLTPSLVGLLALLDLGGVPLLTVIDGASSFRGGAGLGASFGAGAGELLGLHAASSLGRGSASVLLWTSFGGGACGVLAASLLALPKGVLWASGGGGR